MAEITLKEIRSGARHESHRLRHFYIGAEHLFIAMLTTKGSMTSHILQERGLTPEYVVDAIRRKVGKGSKQRMWAGVPTTPRADRLVENARKIAHQNKRHEVYERDLLVAILQEGDSIATRVLDALGVIDVERMIQTVQNHNTENNTHTPYVKVDFSPEFDENALNRQQLMLLRHTFYEYDRIYVERRLPGGFSDSIVLVVVPFHVDDRQDAAVAVKIGPSEEILDEARHYQAYVKAKLPSLTARLEDNPITSDMVDLTALKYTLVADGNRTPQDLRSMMSQWEPKTLGIWLKEQLFASFGHLWWMQKSPFRFQAWREYDWMLPPILTLEVVPPEETPEEARIISLPVKRTRLRNIDYGEIVIVRNFIVQKLNTKKNTVQLAAGHGSTSARAYKIELRGIDPEEAATFYRGEVIEHIAGRVWQTRDEQLLQAVRVLEPDFDPRSENIPVVLGEIEKIPNPIIAYQDLLETYVNGSSCTIHGDLHAGNIMIGQNQSAFLIDFEHTRDGHTVFDWATLEISLLSELVVPAAGESWEDAREALAHIARLNGDKSLSGRVIEEAAALTPNGEAIGQALSAVLQVRQIARHCLEAQERWSEYFTALAFCALRAVSWGTMSIASRRLMVLVSGLAMHELRTRSRPSSDSDTPSPDDETDINTR